MFLMINEEDVRHVAKLARVKLTDEQVKKFSVQLANVFRYMDILNEVDVEGVVETSQVTGLTNIYECDEVKASQSTKEDLLACSQLALDSDQIRVLKTIK